VLRQGQAGVALRGTVVRNWSSVIAQRSDEF